MSKTSMINSTQYLTALSVNNYNQFTIIEINQNLSTWNYTKQKGKRDRNRISPASQSMA